MSRFIGYCCLCLLVLWSAASAQTPTMFLEPVGGQGGQIVVNPGDTLVVEVFIRDISPPLLRGYQATLPNEASGGSVGSVDFVPNNAPGCGSDCSPRIDTTRPDYAYFGVSGVFPVTSVAPLPRVAVAAFGGSEVSVTEARYCGEFTYQVSNDAIGTFTIDIVTEANASSLSDPNQQPIPFTALGAVIHVACTDDASCDDGLFCTGPERCVDGMCEPGGEPCAGDPDRPLCDEQNDRCVACFDDAACDDGLICNGAERCVDGLCEPGANAPAGTPCGDSDQTACDDPDTCDGDGSCLDNVAPDGAPCDDGRFCHEGEVCTSGVCGGGQDLDCDDALSCTADACNEEADRCDHVIDEGFCLIDGVCYAAGQTNPQNACEQCDPTVSTTDWTAGQADTCFIDGVCYFAGDTNPANECETCTPASSATQWSPKPDDSACSDDGMQCTDDVCRAGTCVHPDSAEGTPCDDGNSCTGTGAPGVGDDVCDGAGGCAGELDPNCSDDCVNAVTVADGPNTGSNVGFGEDDAEASCQPVSNNDAWFAYTAPCDGPVRVTTAGSAFAPSNDTVLSVLDGCGGAEIACDDDSGPGLLSALVFDATAGSTYVIRVAGFDQNAGAIQLNIRRLDTCLVDGLCVPDGQLNPDNPCEVCSAAQSTMGYSAVVKGTACGDPGAGPCDSPDACDGQGHCEANHKPDGSRCPTDDNDCTVDVCMDGACSHQPMEAGSSCGDPTDSACDHQDTCDGAGTCLSNFEPAGTPCNDQTSTDCNAPDTCDGAGACLDNLAADGTACSDDGNECTDDVCDGGQCAHPNRPAGTPCGDPADSACDNPDTCDASGVCQLNLEPDSTPCDDGTPCTGPDGCSGGVCVGPFIPQPPIVDVAGPRALIVTPQPAGSTASQALRVTSPDYPCLIAYVNDAGRLVDAPVFHTPDEWASVVVADRRIVPSTAYDVAAVCGESASDVASVVTLPWTDVNGDGTVNLDDLFCVLDGFIRNFTNCPRASLDLAPCEPDGVIDIFDLFAVLDAFQGEPYSCAGPCDNGACCTADRCVVATRSACADLGGSYQGDGVDCAANPCGTGSRSGLKPARSR